MLQALYINNQLIAFNKPSGIPVQPDKTEDTPFQELAEVYCKHPLYLIHRIDRPVSGIVLFAKSKIAAANLSEQIHQRKVDKEYLAVVQNLPEQPEGRLVHYIKKNEAKNISTALKEPAPGADMAELEYQVIGSSERYHLLRIKLITGRHHQIRAQLAAIGCPIKGDVKYGARRGNPDRSIHLHAWRLSFDHQVSGERVHIEAPAPDHDPVWKAFKDSIPTS
jgi:23S rRNA pseudouridine1911/1915/1917 synthase